MLPIPLRLKLIDFAQQANCSLPGSNPPVLILLPRDLTIEYAWTDIPQFAVVGEGQVGAFSCGADSRRPTPCDLAAECCCSRRTLTSLAMDTCTAAGIWLDEDMLATRYNAEIGEYYFEYRASLIYPKDDG